MAGGAAKIMMAVVTDERYRSTFSKIEFRNYLCSVGYVTILTYTGVSFRVRLTIFARCTCFCSLLRSWRTAAKRERSSAERRMQTVWAVHAHRLLRPLM